MCERDFETQQDRASHSDSGSARGFAQHHSQQLSRAAVCGDAQNINNAARNMRLAHSFVTGLKCPTPLRAGLLGPRAVSPHPQGLQGSHVAPQRRTGLCELIDQRIG